MSTKTRATIEDLYKVEGKAELVHGEIVTMPPKHPLIFRRGDVADAEPAVPGWQMPVDDLFV
jgi:hypothetical protein